MSSIMKGIVDEGDWTGGIINWKKEVTSKHGPDVTFKKRKLPGVNGKTDTYATNSEDKVVGVYQHHNDMGRVLSENDVDRISRLTKWDDKVDTVKAQIKPLETKMVAARENGDMSTVRKLQKKINALYASIDQEELRETEAKKGIDGKRCWKGKRYAGTENGKDKCIPVKEESETKWEVAIEYGPTANHTAKIKVSAPDADTAQSKALAQFKKKFPDRRGMVGDCTQIKEAANPVQAIKEFADDEKSEQPRREHPITIYIYSILHNKTITIVGEKLKRIPYGTYDQVHVEFTVPTSGETRTMWMPVTDKKYPTGALSDNVYLSNSQKSNNTVTDGIFNYWAYEPNVNEGVIVGHDANDPEVAILGGAGTMSLSRLKKKAHAEALQLADDIANGKYNASSYNMKQLHNTLNTIVAAEKEMEKSYFGENAWNQLGQRKPNTNLPAPERGSRVNHGKRFEEGDIVLPLSGPLKGQPHKVIHSQRTSIRIVPLGRNTYPGDTIAPRTKHEWVVPADMNEDYTGEFAAEKTCETNPYGSQKDRQFRGAISETPTDNPTGASGEGGWRRMKESSILKGLKRESK